MSPRHRSGAPARSTTREQQTKKQIPSSNDSQDKTATKRHSLLMTFQQKILDVFAQAFSNLHEKHDLKSVMQQVKGHLFNRDFHAAFSKPEYLEVYALRWSAARALAYAEIFTREDRHVWLRPVTKQRQLADQTPASTTSFIPMTEARQHRDRASTASEYAATDFFGIARIVCIGGGAGGELLALAAASAHLDLRHQLQVVLVDVADWSVPVQQLRAALATPPPTSAYASQAIKDANTAFLDPDKITVEFLHRDVLDPSLTFPELKNADADADASAREEPTERPVQEEETSKPPTLFADVSLVTIMFTLNELFSVSLPKTTAFLLQLTDAMPSESHLVVVDSPGSYSEIKLGRTGEFKQYPMKWLLDHTLLDVAGPDRWTKIEAEDSMWFRLEDKSPKLRYPVALENCRYQIHAYRKR